MWGPDKPKKNRKGRVAQQREHKRKAWKTCVEPNHCLGRIEYREIASVCCGLSWHLCQSVQHRDDERLAVGMLPFPWP